MQPTRENRHRGQSDLVGVSVTTGSPTAGVCGAVMENTNVPSSQCRSLARSEKVGDEQVNKLLWENRKPCSENEALRNVAQTAGSQQCAVRGARLSGQTLSER
jgi:hypothetical protein